jgi:magnesium-transporting ATPase (P-type)
MSQDSSRQEMFKVQKMFWQLLSVCHNVLPEYPEDDDGNIDKVKYQASSPDEAALVMAAKEIGFKFSKGTPILYHIINDLTGEKEQWKILATIEFNSTRKRMSIITETPEGKILLLTKGADNIIMERLDPNAEHMSPLKETTEHLGAFAEIGLRTLCLAFKELTKDE